MDTMNTQQVTLAEKAKNWHFSHEKINPEDLEFCLKTIQGDPEYASMSEEELYDDYFYCFMEVTAFMAHELIKPVKIDMGKDKKGKEMYMLTVETHPDLELSSLLIDNVFTGTEGPHEMVHFYYEESLKEVLLRQNFWKK